MGGILSFLFAVLIFVILVARRWIRRHHLAVITVVGIALIASAFAANRYYSGSKLQKKVDDSLRVRMGFWEGAARLIERNPWKGVGPGNFGDRYLHFKDASAHEVKSAHNNFLQLWAEAGAGAMLAFALILLLILLKSYSGLFPARKSEEQSPVPPRPGGGPPPSLALTAAAATILAFLILTLVINAFNVALSVSFIFAAVLIICAVFFIRSAYAFGETPHDPCIFYGVFAGLCGFSLHSFVDFDLYVPGIAQSIFVASAAILAFRKEGEPKLLVDRSIRLPFQLIIAAAVIAFYFFFLFNIVQPIGEAGLNYENARREFYKNGNIQKARELARLAVEADDKNADYHYFLGKVNELLWLKAPSSSRLEYFRAAEKEYCSASFLNPDNCRYPLDLARLYLKEYRDTEDKESLEVGIDYLREAIQLYPTNPRFWKEYGDALALAGKNKSMIYAYEEAQKLQTRVDQRHVKLSDEEMFLLSWKIMQYSGE